MPRQARLDAPGTLHHVIVRGIEKRRIVDDNKDRRDGVVGDVLQIISLLFNEQVVFSLFSSISPSSESRARPFSIVAGVALKVFCSNFSNFESAEEI